MKKLNGWQNYSYAEKNKIKNSFAYGFAKGVKEAFEEQKSANEIGWGLVMVVPKEVNEACSDFRVDKYVSRHSVYNDVTSSGREEGRKFNPNKRLEHYA